MLAFLFDVAAIGSASEAAIVMAPALADGLALGRMGVGWITAMFGLGGLLGVWGHRMAGTVLGPRGEGCLAMGLLAAAGTTIGMWHSMLAMGVSLVVGGAGMLMGISAFSFGVQLLSPAPMLGRVMALWVIAFAGVRPLASVALGFVADRASPSVAILGAAATLFLCTPLVFLAARRGVERDEDPASLTQPVGHRMAA